MLHNMSCESYYLEHDRSKSAFSNVHLDYENVEVHSKCKELNIFFPNRVNFIVEITWRYCSAAWIIKRCKTCKSQRTKHWLQHDPVMDVADMQFTLSEEKRFCDVPKYINAEMAELENLDNENE